MRNLLLGILIGFVSASLLAIPVLKFAIADKYEFGRKNGVLQGESEVIRFLSQHFRAYRPPEQQTDKLVLKPGGVYIVEKDGRKSVEVTIH